MLRVSTCNMDEVMVEDLPFIYKNINFPDGTQKIDFLEPLVITPGNCYVITWVGYEGDEELARLIFITKHLKDKFNAKVYLNMPYIPNARMDRTKSDSEVFTLKYFADVINWLGFEKVFVFDPHSNVSEALIDHIVVISPEDIIKEVIERARTKFVYFPDEGAFKRYSGMECFKGLDPLIGHKKRDWKTGEIIGLNITSPEGYEFEDGHFMGCRILMVDDIISFGGTLAYSADVLSRLGFTEITAYASHVENSILNEEKGKLLDRLKSGIVKKVYTTDSLFTKESNYIDIIKNF